MDTYSSLAAVALVSLLAAISPGPDFFIVLKNSLVYSRRNGFFTAAGVATALVVHLSYTLVGIGILIAESPYIYSLIKVIGALYLFYLGSKGLISSFKKSVTEVNTYQKSSNDLSAKAAFMQGFFTNVLNPKCAIFFISLFSQFINPTTPALLKLAYAVINWALSFGWFLFLAFIVTGPQLQNKLGAFRGTIDRGMGSALILLGLKLLFV